MDPYHNADAFQWFLVLWRRLWSWSGGELYPDEVQLIALLAFGVSAAIVGAFFVVHRQTLLANTLSHTMLLGVVLGYISAEVLGCSTQSPLVYVIAGAVGMASGYLVEWLRRAAHFSSDASNGVVLALFFALGVVGISVYNKDAHVGVELVMGDPEALVTEDILPMVTLAGVIAAAAFVWYRGLVVTLFDEGFATVVGLHPQWYRRGMLLVASMASIVSFRAVGFVMTMAFFVLPSLIVRRYVRSVGGQVMGAIWCSVGTVLVSVGLSRHLYSVYALPLSTGALAAVLLALWYGMECVILRARGHKNALNG